MKTILILDCGSRFLTKLDAAIHKAGAITAILTVPVQGNMKPIDARFPVLQDVAVIDEIEPAGVIISGSPYYIYTKQGRVPPAGFLNIILRRKIPLLGICGGYELLAHLITLNDSQRKPPRVVGVNPTGRYEPEEISSNPCKFTQYVDDQLAISCGNVIFDGLPSSFPVWMYHIHQVLVLPPYCIAIGKTPGTAIAAIAYYDPLEPEPFMFGVQFHPEVSPIKTRYQIFHNFIERSEA